MADKPHLEPPQEDAENDTDDDDVEGVEPPSREEIAQFLKKTSSQLGQDSTDRPKISSEIDATKHALQSMPKKSPVNRHASCPDLRQTGLDVVSSSKPLSPFARYTMHLDTEKDEAWDLLEQLNAQCIEGL